MVEYLPVGPKGAPKTIFGKKYFGPEIPNPLSQPSVQYTYIVLYVINIGAVTSQSMINSNRMAMGT